MSRNASDRSTEWERQGPGLSNRRPAEFHIPSEILVVSQSDLLFELDSRTKKQYSHPILSCLKVENLLLFIKKSALFYYICIFISYYINIFINLHIWHRDVGTSTPGECPLVLDRFIVVLTENY